MTDPGLDGAAPWSVLCLFAGVSTSIGSSAFLLVPLSSFAGASSDEDEDDPDEEDDPEEDDDPDDEDDPDEDDDFLAAFVSLAGAARAFAEEDEESLLSEDDPELEVLELDFLFCFWTAFLLLDELEESLLSDEDPEEELDESLDARSFAKSSASFCASSALF